MNNINYKFHNNKYLLFFKKKKINVLNSTNNLRHFPIPESIIRPNLA